MKVSISSLGGIGEIGMNIYVYETDRSAFIVDCGVKFAGATEPGVDLIIPDFSYLHSIKHKLKCLVITHAHEDHGGAIAYLLREIPMPIAAHRHTMNLLEHRLKENDLSPEKAYLTPENPLTIDDFTVNFIPLSHSIHGTGALYIEAADGFTALHISDYKIDFAPVSATPFPLEPFLNIGKKGLNCLLADSTNCLRPGFTKGEKSVIEPLNKIFKETEGRIFFTTFASNTERLQTIFRLAEKHGRKVAIEGSSLTKHITAARQGGYLRINDDMIIQRKHINRLPDNEICVVATGSQAEQASVITKIAKNDYGNINVREGDLFIFSSRAIPGNEQNIINVMNKIAKAGGKTISASDSNVHVSGHASEEDTKLLIKLTKPEYLIPVHGEYIHLMKHREIAITGCGFQENRVIISSAGERLTFTDGLFTDREDIPCGKRFVDMKGGFLLDVDHLKERKRLASEGAVFVYVPVDLKKGDVAGDIVCSSAGFELEPYMANALANRISDDCSKEVFERFTYGGWEETVFKIIKKHFKKTMNRRPVITAVIREIV